MAKPKSKFRAVKEVKRAARRLVGQPRTTKVKQGKEECDHPDVEPQFDFAGVDYICTVCGASV